MSVFICGIMCVRLWHKPTRLLCDRLLSNAKAINHSSVPCFIHTAKIVEQPSSASDQLQESATGMVIFLMGFEMFGQIRDPVGQHRNLNFGEPESLSCC